MHPMHRTFTLTPDGINLALAILLDIFLLDTQLRHYIIDTCRCDRADYEGFYFGTEIFRASRLNLVGVVLTLFLGREELGMFL